ncbi:unnamed protein product [Orchesella dallaii]|uniref:Carrier domain-containing protein n=1 Tax=Orchesella dallaii TaxID=48710 RepID=A0ABP1Q0W9_9HEXA
MMNNDLALTCLPSLKRNESNWTTLLSSLSSLYISGLEINWKGFDQLYKRSKVSLPNYPFTSKKFWPESISSTTSSIHPLLGTVLSNPSSSKLFQCGLSTKQIEYVKDHTIGNNVIFPGAGFLEMCLAAGLATIEASTDSLSPPSRAMKIENLSIEAPLRLQESSTCQLHTVAEFNSTTSSSTPSSGEEWNDLTIKIFKANPTSDSIKWVNHASATFSPMPTPQEKEPVVRLNHKQFLETLEKPSDDEFITQIYDKLASVGLKFGPSFKSIEKLWRDKDCNGKGTLVAKIKVPFESQDEGGEQPKYIVHPVVLDAMIQALVMLRPTSNLKKSLYVPIKIGKFVWISSTTCKELYIQSFEATGSSLLLDSEGKLLGVMSSVELIETTVKTIESILEQQTTSMPHLWEEIWKPSPTPLLLSGDAKASSGKFYTEEFRREFEANYSTPSEYVHQTLQFLEQFIYLHTIQALYETGWAPKLNQEFGEKSLSQQLKIVPAFHQYFGFICDMLRAKGILEKLSENKDELTWKIIKLPPSHHQISKLLSTPELSTYLNQRFPPTPLFQKVGESLSSFFSGTKTPISVIFPEGPKTCPTVADVYIEYFNQVHVSKLEEIGGLLIKHFWNTQPNKQVEVRILEVGAGTGSCSQKLMDIMAENGIRFEYTYTDISAAFFPAAEKRLEKHLKWVKFKKLNIEEDPLAQSFAPDYYDFVLAGEVIHATKDICESLRNIRVLMKPYGRIAIQETTRLSLLIGFLFGTLEGYWRFQDFELRKRYCILEKAAWAQVMEANGLKNEVMFSVYDNYHSYMVSQKTEELPLLPISAGGWKKWLVFHEEGHPVSEYIRERIVKVAGRSVVSIKRGAKFEEGRDESWFTLREKEYEDFVHLFQAVLEKPGEIEGIVYCWSLDKTAFSQDEVLQPYFNLSKSLLTLNLKKNPRLAVITENVVPLEENELSSFPNSTLWGFTKSMKNENVNLNCKCIEVIGSDGESEEEKNLRLEEIFHELWSSEKDTQVAFSGKRRWIPKFTPHKPIIDPLKLPNGTNRFQLVLPETRSISDLQFGNLDVGTVREDEVEVEIRASALNFRDVLSVIKPSEEFKDSNTVGFDFSGVVTRIGDKVGKWRVGDCVFGCNIYFTAMPSHLTLSQDLLLKLPENLSFCEGATMPAVYATSVLCLLDVAKIKKDDVVLLHTASGGVGLSAIEICKHVGCTIIATAGSKRKQNYLRSLGIQHIFHSRNTQYGDQILELTKGRGVDVVLNSLTSEGLKEATLKACAKGARFVEMSVLNIWSKEEVNKLRPDVHYTTIDLSKSNKGEWIRLLDSLRNLSINGSMVMKPIPYTRFDAVNIREALQYMQKAKHIGKVVCTMPQLRMEGECELKTFTPMFNPTSTYLITGGLGGIGFAVCKWMLEKGGKHFLLAGRSLPTPTIQSKINELNSKGANIIPVQLDVSSFEQCKELIKNKLPNLKLPPLKGVMHAAGTLADGIITNLDWSKYELTFNAKVSGTFNLHELTKHLNLEHFVTFSSMAAMLGSLGQSNHSAGNCFEDAISHYRHSIGLPSTSINWGQWGEVGVATEVDFPGMKPISNLQAFSAIEYALNSQRAQLAVLNVDSVQVIGMIYSQMSVYLDERLWNASRATVKTTINSEEFWRQYDSLIEAEEKLELVKTQLQSILRTTLKLDDMEVVNCDSNLQEMGVDSLMFVEIKNCLQTLMGERVTVNAGALRDCNTVNLIVSVMMRMIEGDDELENETAIPTLEQVNELIREDCILPEDITPKLAAPAPPICEVKKVLLTGATGVLGSYILKELSNSPQITQVICILRGNNKEKARARLENVLRDKNLLSKVAMEKIQCVMGDVALPHLGLEEHVWKELSGSVDAIFNCSAKVDHTERYRKGSSRRDGRAVNIGGTKNLLQFACEQRLKHFFQASSILAVLTADGNNQLTEDWPEVGDYDNVGTFSYQISKFVGDVLVKEAVKRGIPCRVFRFPLLSGESETGQCEPSTNHALLRFMFMLKKGIMASLPWPLIMLPVDVCAKATIRIFFDERAPQSDIYNVGIAKPDVEQEFVNVAAKLGYKVDLVEFSEFVKILKDTENNDKTLTQERPLLNMFLEMYSDEDFILGMYANTAVLHRWLEGCPNVFRNRKMETFLPEFYEEQQPTMEYIYKDLMYVKSQGWFGKFGL